ncbi:MAG: hypothetical protein PHF00_06805 [Elusimicrobia bacterium]|nr:hypothetical protein [Elusimicrobiota bacterium]
MWNWMLVAALGLILPVQAAASGLPDFSFTGIQDLPPAQDVAAVVGKPVAQEPWAQDAREICNIWRAHNPKTWNITLEQFAKADGQFRRSWNDTATGNLPLCEFAARELSKIEGPARSPRLWRVALAYWISGSSLKPNMRFSAGGMTTEGLTDANWRYCVARPDAVADLLGVLGRTRLRHSNGRSGNDMMNPFFSIRWWMAEYLDWRSKLPGSRGWRMQSRQNREPDNWDITGAVFLPVAYSNPNSRRLKRVQREIRVWKQLDAANASLQAGK